MYLLYPKGLGFFQAWRHTPQLTVPLAARTASQGPPQSSPGFFLPAPPEAVQGGVFSGCFSDENQISARRTRCSLWSVPLPVHADFPPSQV